MSTANDFMKASEAAVYLKLGVSTVYQLCAEGVLAHYRVGARGGQIRITRADCDAYTERCRRDVVSEETAAATSGAPTIKMRGCTRLDGTPLRHVR